MKSILRIVRLSVGFSTFAFSPDREKRREISAVPERIFHFLSGQTSISGINLQILIGKIYVPASFCSPVWSISFHNRTEL
jgi:hypothetical protein